jgi:hypothetical protein
MGPRWRTSRSLLLGACLALVSLSVLHDLDHVRQDRPLPAVLTAVGIIGPAAAAFALLLVARRHHLAPAVAALVGAGSLVGLIAVHLLPRWSVFSDPYPEVQVDALAWTSLGLFMLAASAVGTLGLLRRRA